MKPVGFFVLKVIELLIDILSVREQVVVNCEQELNEGKE